MDNYMKHTFLFFFLMANAISADELIPSKENCNFYLKLEQQENCHIYTNYLKHYGFKYCNLFLQAKKNWGLPLQTWVEQTAFCLQEKLLEYHLEYVNNNQQDYCYGLEKAAFASHPDCYKNNGFCQLSYDQQLKVISKITNLDILLNPKRTLQQALLIAVDCAKETCNLL